MKIVNILIFAGAFILVTAGLIFLNSMFTNIFQFDFSPATEISAVQDSTKTETDNANLEKEIKDDTLSVAADTLKSVDSLTTSDTSENIVQTKTEKPVTLVTKTPQPLSTELSLPENYDFVNDAEPETDFLNSKDSTYIKWVKDTAKMFEVMEPKKAAKIIAIYPNERARDIMYKMKKNKAALILAELDPVSATRITRYSGQN